eukprot:jgi/Ulvmu1/11514/UM078_0003.1
MGIGSSRPPASGPDLASGDTEVFNVAKDIATITSTSVATVGPVGVGKSSLLNTVASYTGNALTLQAAAGIGSRSLTPGLTSHTLIFQEKHAAWKWIDTAGDTFDQLVQKFKCQSIPEGEDGQISMDEYEQHLRENVLTPLQALKVGCIVVVLSGKAIWHEARTAHPHKGHHEALEIPSDGEVALQLKALKHLHESVAHQGMRMICILTKADQVHRSIKDNICSVRHSWPLYRLRELVAKNVGLPENQIYPVVNMVHEYRPEDNWSLGYLALLPVQAALRAARSAGDQTRVVPDADGFDTLTEPTVDVQWAEVPSEVHLV